MKKITLVLALLIASAASVMAQNYVSTEPANRNVIIEEFTGRNCGYCPDGHLIANNIVAAHPGRVWAVNIHAGGYATNTYPNFLTNDGTTIHNGFSISGYPTGAVNRSSQTAIVRGQWAGVTNQKLAQASEVNVDGVVIVDPVLRTATIHVEAYYTADGPGTTNKMTVVMLQDNILGSQAGMSGNPGQVIGNQYNHMHILRDVISSTAWGDEISPISAGTLIQEELTYQIPESIGTPNGVDVIIDDVYFLVYVAANNYNILSACELTKIIGSDAPINPGITAFEQKEEVVCGLDKTAVLTLLNGGTDELTSLGFNIDIDGVTSTYNWAGNIASYSGASIEIPLEIPVGTSDVTFSINTANGTTIEPNNMTTVSGEMTTEDWLTHDNPTSTITVRIWQDRFGNQTYWYLYDGANELIASGGPYSILPSAGTELHEHIVPVPASGCYNFKIIDTANNGINNTQGAGHYEIVDDEENIIIESDGQYGSGETYLMSLVSGSAPTTYAVTITKEPENGGNVTGAGTYNAGSVVTITATPAQGFIFSTWFGNGSFITSDPSYTFTISQDMAFNAVFAPEVGIEDLSDAIAVYPNPVENTLNISMGEDITNATIYDVFGRKVLVSGNATSIDVSSLSNGMYILRVNTAQGSHDMKFIKK